MTVVAKRRLGCDVRLLERRVRAADEERAQGRVGRDVRRDEPDGRERDDAEDQPRAQGEPREHGYTRSASSMYPACRTVLIRGGPVASSFRRR